MPAKQWSWRRSLQRPTYGRGNLSEGNTLLRCLLLLPCLTVCHTCRIALFNLDEYESAKEAFETAHSLDKRRETEIWIRKCNAELEGKLHRPVAVGMPTTWCVSGPPFHCCAPEHGCASPCAGEMQSEPTKINNAPASKPMSAMAAPTVGAAGPPTTPTSAASVSPALQQPNGAHEVMIIPLERQTMTVCILQSLINGLVPACEAFSCVRLVGSDSSALHAYEHNCMPLLICRTRNLRRKTPQSPWQRRHRTRPAMANTAGSSSKHRPWSR